MLAVIQHQQQLPAGQHPPRSTSAAHPRLLPYPQRRRRSPPEPAPDPSTGASSASHAPSANSASHPPGHLTGQPGLPRTARPRHRHQPVPPQQPRHLGHRPGPADETGQRGREAVHATEPPAARSDGPRPPCGRPRAGSSPERGQPQNSRTGRVQALQPVTRPASTQRETPAPPPPDPPPRPASPARSAPGRRGPTAQIRAAPVHRHAGYPPAASTACPVWTPIPPDAAPPGHRCAATPRCTSSAHTTAASPRRTRRRTRPPPCPPPGAIAATAARPAAGTGPGPARTLPQRLDQYASNPQFR